MSNIVSIPVAGDKLDDIFVNHTTEFLYDSKQYPDLVLLV